MRGRAKGQFAAIARPTRSAASSDRLSGTSAGVWITRSVRQVSRPTVTAFAPARRAAGCPPECRAEAAGSGPGARAAPSALATAAADARATAVVAHHEELPLVVDGVEVDDLDARPGFPEPGRRPARPPGRTPPPPVIRMPVAASDDASAKASAATTPLPLSRAPRDVPRSRPRARQGTRHHRERRAGRAPPRAEAVPTGGRPPAAAAARPPRASTQTATSRPAMDCPWALVSRWATIHRRIGAPRT